MGNPKTSFISEDLVTHFTLKMFFFCMKHQMFIQILLVGKELATDFTLELNSLVSRSMLLQLFLSRILLWTFKALKWKFPLV